MVIKEKKTEVEKSFDSLASINFKKYENEWILMVGGEIVYHAPTEREVLEHSKKYYSDVVPCLVKVPKYDTNFSTSILDFVFVSFFVIVE